MRSAPLILIVGVAAILSGCASTRPAPPPTTINTTGSDLVAAEALPFWLGPQGPVEVWMKITAGKDTGKSWHVVPTNITRRQSDAGPPPALDTFTLEWTLEGEATPRSVREMRLEPDGDVVMARVVQHDRNVTTVFDPPILVMPARINPGAVVRQDSKVVVYELKNPKKIKEKGDATLEARFIGEAETPSEPRAQARGQTTAAAPPPAEPTRTRLYTTHLTLNLSAAKSERSTTRRFDLPPPQGTGTLLEESYEEKIRVLGVTIESTRQTMTLAGTADTTPAPTAPSP